MDDEYWHDDELLYYVPENCPGLGCDVQRFNQQLVGCRCSPVCGASCPCGRAVVSRVDDASSLFSGGAATKDVGSSSGGAATKDVGSSSGGAATKDVGSSSGGAATKDVGSSSGGAATTNNEESSSGGSAVRKDDGCSKEGGFVNEPDKCSSGNVGVEVDVASSSGTFAGDCFGAYRECGSLCVCGATCLTRVVQRGARPGLTVFNTGGPRGLGLSTDRAIRRGEFVCCYAGEVIGPAEARRRFGAQCDRRNYILAVREHYSGSTDITYIDATRVANLGRYINHSCRPNLRLTAVRLDSLVPHAALFTVRDVSAGEELTFSYGPAAAARLTAESAGGKPCLCGESVCTGRLPTESAD